MNEAELRQAMSTLEIFRAQLESINQNQQLVQISLEELGRAKETLVQYQKAKEGDEILLPVGGNSFVFAKVATNAKAIVGIGTGISVEKSMDEAIKTMDDRAARADGLHEEARGPQDGHRGAGLDAVPGGGTGAPGAAAWSLGG
jgi:prefoldin alpha subunit